MLSRAVGAQVGFGLKEMGLADKGIVASAAKMGTTGLFFGGLFQPTSSSNFWAHRVNDSILGAATFSLMGAAFEGLGSVSKIASHSFAGDIAKSTVYCGTLGAILGATNQ